MKNLMMRKDNNKKKPTNQIPQHTYIKNGDRNKNRTNMSKMKWINGRE